jgi:hypothetical protein
MDVGWELGIHNSRLAFVHNKHSLTTSNTSEIAAAALISFNGIQSQIMSFYFASEVT